MELYAIRVGQIVLHPLLTVLSLDLAGDLIFIFDRSEHRSSVTQGAFRTRCCSGVQCAPAALQLTGKSLSFETWQISALQKTSTAPVCIYCPFNICVLKKSFLNPALNKTCLGIDPPSRTAVSTLME